MDVFSVSYSAVRKSVNLHQRILPAAEAQRRGGFNGVDAVAAFHPLQKMRLAGVVTAVHQIDARLIDGNGICGNQNAHVRHAGVFRNFTAVAVNAHVLHNVDENHVAVEVIHNAAGCVRHGFQKRIMIRRPEVFRHARAVDIRLAVGRCHADGQLLQCAAVAAHGMSLEVGKYQHGIVIFQIFADKIFLDDLAVRDIQLHIGAFGIQQIYREIAAPTVLVHQLAVLLGGVAGAAIGSVALHDGAADVVDHRFPELRAKEILISLFTGMQLDRDIAGERLGTLFIYKQDATYSIDDIILSEYGTAVVGLEMLRSVNEESAEETRKEHVVQAAISTLSFSELEAIIHIFDELDGTEGILVASKIADRVGITRSVIVNALRKFESAGVIESRSSGMKGTYIKVLNDVIFDELEELKARKNLKVTEKDD